MHWKSLPSYIIAAEMTTTGINVMLTAAAVVKKSLSKILYSDVTRMYSGANVRTVCQSSKWQRTERPICLTMTSTCRYRQIEIILWSSFSKVTAPELFQTTSMSKFPYRLLYSLVVECWHRVREVPSSIPSQGPRHTKDGKMVPGSSLACLALNWLFLKN